jgi:hypothetical protein
MQPPPAATTVDAAATEGEIRFSTDALSASERAGWPCTFPARRPYRARTVEWLNLLGRRHRQPETPRLSSTRSRLRAPINNGATPSDVRAYARAATMAQG